MGQKLLEVSDACGFALDKTPCYLQLFMGKPSPEWAVLGGGGGGLSGVQPCDQCYDLKGESVKSPWLISLENHLC